MENSRFLATEKLTRLMIKFSVPCTLSLLVSALYNIVDQIFVGNSELSTLGNAATGVVFPIFIIAQAFAWCFGDGCAAYLNICQGRADTQNAHKAIGTGILVTLACSIVIPTIFYPLKTQILTLFGASENSIGYAVEYFNIILAFFPVFMLSNMMNAVIRADGSPSVSMASMLAGALANIALDPILIFGAKWGMSGAAIATVIGQTISFVITLVYFIRSTKTFKLSKKSFIPDFKEFSGALRLGASSFITQMTIVVISLVCNIMLVKYGMQSRFGIDIPIALIGIESKVFTVVINLVVGIVLGCQPIISYNMGAKNYSRVKELYRNILICTAVIGIAATLLFELAPDAVVGIFGAPRNIPNPDDYWEFGRMTFRIFLSFVTFTCTIKMTSIFFQAVGKPISAVIASMIRDIICFIPLIIILPRFFGITGILYAAPAADMIAMIVAAALTIKFMKSLKAAPHEKSSAVLKPSKPGVIITIAREHGSSGKEIGKIIAEKLGIPFYYKEMTALAAQESGLDKEFISDINSNAPDLLQSLYLSSSVITQAIAAQEKVIKKIADQGSCVIVGRAADYVLRNYENVIRIFIYANEEYKISRVMKIYGDQYKQAKENVRHSDESRAAYYKNISQNTWGARENYELLIDSSLGVYLTAETICEYVSRLGKTVK